MTEKENILNELKEIAPRLSKIEKKEAYLVPGKYFESLDDVILNGVDKEVYTLPENYFDQLPSQVLNRLSGEKREKSRIRKMLPFVSIAASFILICFVVLNIPSSQNTNEFVEEDIDFLIEEMDDMSLAELAFLSEDEIDMEIASMEDLELDEYVESVILELDEKEFLDLIN